jgi:hypothetical protein
MGEREVGSLQSPVARHQDVTPLTVQVRSILGWGLETGDSVLALWAGDRQHFDLEGQRLTG